MPADEPQSGRREAMIRLLRLGGMSAATGGIAIWLNSRRTRPVEPAATTARPHLRVPADPAYPEMVVAQGEEPAVLTRRVIEALGGIRRFISRGDVVVVKPNAAWDRTPEQAADSNPQIVAEAVRLSLEAGARKVIVTDVCIHDARRCFERSGIGPTVRAAGAQVVYPEERLFRNVDLRGQVMNIWPVFEVFLHADKVINIPIAKHHSLAGATLGMKNWYGILGGSRQRLHQRLHESVADLADFMRPTLTLLDAYRVLLRNGPTGGSVSDTVLKKTVIGSTDPVAVDAYAAKSFWDLDWHTLRYLKLASERHLGSLDFDAIHTRFLVL